MAWGLCLARLYPHLRHIRHNTEDGATVVDKTSTQVSPPRARRQTPAANPVPLFAFVFFFFAAGRGSTTIICVVVIERLLPSLVYTDDGRRRVKALGRRVSHSDVLGFLLINDALRLFFCLIPALCGYHKGQQDEYNACSVPKGLHRVMQQKGIHGKQKQEVHHGYEYHQLYGRKGVGRPTIAKYIEDVFHQDEHNGHRVGPSERPILTEG